MGTCAACNGHLFYINNSRGVQEEEEMQEEEVVQEVVQQQQTCMPLCVLHKNKTHSSPRVSQF
jgi:hypothetical protein